MTLSLTQFRQGNCRLPYPLCRSISLLLLLSLAACSSPVQNALSVDALPPIYPDYVGVTVPAELAPLNFELTDPELERLEVTVTGQRGGSLRVSGRWADFPITEWQQLARQNRGDSLTVVVCACNRRGEWCRYRPFPVYVDSLPLADYGLTYRCIEPGYEVGGNISICQRNLSNFDEEPLLTETALPGRCFNCHTANRTDPALFTLQVRGANGGTLVQCEGEQLWYDTRTPQTKAAGSYAYWHPQGRYCAYAVNSVHQSFFVQPGDRMEVFHKFGDVVVLDTQTDRLLGSSLLSGEGVEIFPAFSADGATLYYSGSSPCQVPAEYEKVKCSLCAIAFDADKGEFGQQVDTLLNGPATDRSYVLARPSYDGRWLMYCVADRGNFPVCRSTSDLWLMDLRSGESRPLTEVNTPQSESYHNWSSDSRWFVYSSKGDNGLQSWAYLARVDEAGRVSKPVLLPQRRPLKYYRERFDSFNCPDFTRTPVCFDIRRAFRELFYGSRREVTSSSPRM